MCVTNSFVFSVFDMYVSNIYALQKYLAEMLFISYTSQSNFLYVILFFLGSITIFTPCFISILPLALLYINSRSSFNREITLFIFGVLTSLIILLSFTNLLSSSNILSKLPIISYLILTFVSLDFMEVFSLSSIFYPLNKSINLFRGQMIFLQNYFIGLIIGFSSLPCSTSILLIVNLLSSTFKDLFLAYLSILFYLLGFIISFFIIIKMNVLYSKIYLLYNFGNVIIPITGSILFIFSTSSMLRILFL
uniref:Thiol:disulfide interchange protein n=1 Tax=Polysiphonia urceolata TaxID=173545 RepID=A0A1Z1MCD1_POLUR|nr:thiol:disulfide interchange protein [Polysiphonia stricta]ARW63451.1 thiol:disulfide interchange protein [Polysiphonia stricta]